MKVVRHVSCLGENQKNGDPRFPDVYLEDDSKQTPQYRQDKSLVTEDRKVQPLTLDILKNAGDYMVKGCRTIKGDHRGLSLFNKTNPKLPFDWFSIESETEIKEGLAVTRDASHKVKGSVHYIVVPKDDMRLAHYLVLLKAMGIQAKAV